jgi:hypothetical protein
MIVRTSVALGAGLALTLGGALALGPCVSVGATPLQHVNGGVSKVGGGLAPQQLVVQNASWISHMDGNPDSVIGRQTAQTFVQNAMFISHMDGDPDSVIEG